jgi:hypothetical protein
MVFIFQEHEYKTSFPPHFPNKTTSVATRTIKKQPHYLIVSRFNEVMRLVLGGKFLLLRLFC